MTKHKKKNAEPSLSEADKVKQMIQDMPKLVE